MSLTNAFYEEAVKKAPKQRLIVNSVTEEAPILRGIPMQASSHSLHNVYEDQGDITGASIVDFDEALPTINSETALKQVPLTKIGGTIEVGTDKARIMGGKAAYFASKMPAILRKSGMDAEKSILYNSLRAYAIANSKAINAGGTTANKQNSIICVNWVPGTITGLYDPMWNQGYAFMMENISGGNKYKDSNGVLVYGQTIESVIGMQMASSRYVSTIVNVELDPDGDGTYNALPTEAEMDIMIRNARGTNAGRTFIYCAPEVLDALGSYKSSKLQTVVTDNQFNNRIDMWNGIPIVTSYNFDSNAEAVVS